MKRGAVPVILVILAGPALFGCPPKPPPGDVQMGQYAMTASQGSVGYLDDAGQLIDAGLPPDAGPDGGVVDAGPPPPRCTLVEVTGADFSFDAILTRDSASQTAWMTLNTYSREGTFDGQVLTTTAEANRVFAACSKCSTRVVETISVAVLSRSQIEAAGGLCPENPLDGGVPFDPDAGIVAPSSTQQGYDGVRLCGELTTTVIALGIADGEECDAECGGCTVRYRLRGDRR